MPKAGNQSKIEFYGIGEKVADMLFSRKLTHQEISDKLKAEGHDISRVCITNFHRFIKDSAQEMVTKDPQYRERLAKKYLDTVENLIFALTEIKEKIAEFKTKKTKWKAHATYLGLLLNQLGMLLKRAGEIKPSTFIKEQKVSIIQINQAIQLQIVELIDSGDIPLEHCSEKVKEFYRKIKKERIPVARTV